MLPTAIRFVYYSMVCGQEGLEARLDLDNEETLDWVRANLEPAGAVWANGEGSEDHPKMI